MIARVAIVAWALTIGATKVVAEPDATAAQTDIAGADEGAQTSLSPVTRWLPDLRVGPAAWLEVISAHDNDINGTTVELGGRVAVTPSAYIEFHGGVANVGDPAALINPTLGVTRVWLTPNPDDNTQRRFAARAELTLPVAPADGTAGNIIAELAQLRSTDDATLVAGATTLTLAASRQWRTPRSWFAIDAGGLLRTGVPSHRAIGRVIIGGGLAVIGPFALAAELTTTTFVLDPQAAPLMSMSSLDSSTSNFAETLSFEATYNSRHFSAAAGLDVPTDSARRNADVFGLGLRLTWRP